MAEKRIKRKLVWEDAGVSEIIGTILMLSITVVMFSGIITFVGQMPAPQESFNVEVDCFLEPNDENDWYNGGVKFKMLHQGGKAMDPMWIQIFITVNDTMLKYNLNDGFQLENTDKNGDGWLGVGEYWVKELGSANGPIWEDSVYTITIIHKEKNLLVWQETLGEGDNFYAPIIVDAWIDSDLATPEVYDAGPISYIEDFKIYVNILDPEGFDAEQGLDIDNLWVNLSSIYGNLESPVQLKDIVDDMDALDDDIYVAICDAPNRGNADVGNHYFHFNASDNADRTVERSILFPVGMIVGENPQIVVRGNNVETNKYEYIWFSDAEPVNGDDITIYATIQNLGGGSATVDVNFYDGAVDESLKIGTDQMLLHAQAERDASVDWEASPGGNHTIIVTADVNVTASPDVEDPFLADNQNSTNISVMPKILLVDDDGHLNDLSDGDTVSFMRASLEAADFEYDFVSVGAGDGPGYDYGDYPLQDYDLVIWMTGHTEVNTLT
ncbi:MAG: type IV pilin, partial [Thermoplasmata archaeon]|nr:type IV pilin [Thermoplasmata archaeon]